MYDVDYLKTFRIIVVSGPQRSGTTIAATMIAQDTGHHLVLEEKFAAHDEKEFRRWVEKGQRVVIQAPGMCHLLPLAARDDVLIVMMMRWVSDIMTSEKRIKWAHNYREIEHRKYDTEVAWVKENDSAISLDNAHIAVVKYYVWRVFQRDRCRHWLGLEYESLSDHPLWIPKEKRKRFTDRQIAP